MSAAFPSSDAPEPVDPPVTVTTSANFDAALRSDIAAIIAPYLARPENVGLAVGVYQQGRRAAFGFGRIARDRETVPDENTVYEIGSITKVFTANLLADLRLSGRVRLADPAQRYLPETVRMPTCAGKEITLFHLATHTSSLPRLPANLDATVKDSANPYANYTVEDLYSFLSGHRLPRRIGNRADYSNLGTGLLGHILERAAGKPYEELVCERLCQPLALHDTSISLTEEQRARLAPGHDERGEPTSNWDLPTLGGAGALRSTAADMLRYLEANLGNAPQPVLTALRKCQILRSLTRTPQWRWSHAAFAVLLAGVTLLVQWWWPIPPGSLPFFLAYAVPTLLSAYFFGLFAGLCGAAFAWVGNIALWDNAFGWQLGGPAGLVLAFWAAADRGSFSVLPGWQHLGLPNGCLLLWHNGGTGGYRSWCGYVRETQTAVVVLANSHLDTDDIGMKIMKLVGKRDDDFYR